MKFFCVAAFRARRQDWETILCLVKNRDIGYQNIVEETRNVIRLKH